MNGKRSICWDCGAPMIMTPVQLEMDRPICMNCKLGIDDVTDLPMTDALQDYLTKQNKKVS